MVGFRLNVALSAFHAGWILNAEGVLPRELVVSGVRDSCDKLSRESLRTKFEAMIHEEW